MEGRCASDHGGNEVYPAIFENEEKTGLKLDKRRSVGGLPGNKRRAACALGLLLDKYKHCHNVERGGRETKPRKNYYALSKFRTYLIIAKVV